MRIKRITVILAAAGLAITALTVGAPSSATAATVGTCPTGLTPVAGSERTTSWGSGGVFGGSRTTWRCSNADGSIIAIGSTA
jgi:hypothetical protein